MARSQANRLVALKYVANSQAGDREFEGLINYSKLPESPHLIRILHLGKLEDGFFYTMELADGQQNRGNYIPETLAAKLKREKRLSVTEAIELANAMLDALQTLHENGMVHRDVKPENILYVNRIPKLSDVGLIRSAEQSVSIGGTLGFI
ncbi:MAG: protein kinase, partial [Lentisphaeria bacterium]|nr:protein kinase [Lentisphaeria bacterium]